MEISNFLFIRMNVVISSIRKTTGELSWLVSYMLELFITTTRICLYQLVIPGGIMPLEERKAVQATLIASRYGGRSTLPGGANERPLFKWPVKGNITSRFGWRDGSFHYGLDIAVPYGSYIGAAAPGVVDFTGFQKGYGLMLVVNHGGGWSTLYAHNSRLLVEKNEEVTAGQPVALVGASGNATGPHLHLEIAYNGRKLDPLLFLPYNN